MGFALNILCYEHNYLSLSLSQNYLGRNVRQTFTMNSHLYVVRVTCMLMFDPLVFYLS